MISLFFLILFLDLAFLFVASSIDGFSLLMLLVPWTFFIYAIFCLKGLNFSSNDSFQHLAGKLFWLGQGVFQATVIAIINVILGALLIPDSSIAQFEQEFGVFSSGLILMLCPLPSFFILNFKKEDQERLYQLIFQDMIRKGESLEFIELTTELLSKKDRFTEEYRNQLDKVREYSYQFIEKNYPQIAPFFNQKQSFRLNLDNLAIFLTKNIMTPEIYDVEVKSTAD
ncbi:MAG: hypothetical protein JSV04_12820 [Candidatus Heimdallarchaeota archaeon]|nr:MAG: hypothetical protein JSV04_12820 [Candidatus Heimdallarchaeota archaeon]